MDKLTPLPIGDLADELANAFPDVGCPVNYARKIHSALYRACERGMARSKEMLNHVVNAESPYIDSVHEKLSAMAEDERLLPELPEGWFINSLQQKGNFWICHIALSATQSDALGGEIARRERAHGSTARFAVMNACSLTGDTTRPGVEQAVGDGK